MRLWMLPDGVEESLPAMAWRVEGLRRKLLDHYHERRYELVLPPLIEHLDTLLTGAASDLESQTFKLTDPEGGRLLGLRADMTPQAARIAARHFADREVVRLCYLGTVLRTRPDSLGGSRAPRQVGCELFGETTLAGDVEILRLMLDTLALAGLRDVHLDLGHVSIYRALIGKLGLDPGDEALVFDILQRKSQPDLSDFGASLRLAPQAVQRLSGLIELNGDVTVLQRARATLAADDAAIADALAALESVAQELARVAPDVTLHIDLCELRGARYHTGLSFAAFVPGHGRDLARGGRYDGVGHEFGKARAATGFSADVNELLRLAKDF
jgi:ATP phosphoribosyltransferase regulatory subunit